MLLTESARKNGGLLVIFPIYQVKLLDNRTKLWFNQYTKFRALDE